MTKVRSTESVRMPMKQEKLQQGMNNHGFVLTFKKVAEHLRDGIVKLFNIAYRGRPFTGYPELVDLHKKNGVDLPSCYH